MYSKNILDTVLSSYVVYVNKISTDKVFLITFLPRELKTKRNVQWLFAQITLPEHILNQPIQISLVSLFDGYTRQIQVNLDMTDHCTRTTVRQILVPVRCISSIRHMYTTDFAYDGRTFLVPLSPSYPSSPVIQKCCLQISKTNSKHIRKIYIII